MCISYTVYYLTTSQIYLVSPWRTSRFGTIGRHNFVLYSVYIVELVLFLKWGIWLLLPPLVNHPYFMWLLSEDGISVHYVRKKDHNARHIKRLRSFPDSLSHQHITWLCSASGLLHSFHFKDADLIPQMVQTHCRSHIVSSRTLHIM